MAISLSSISGGGRLYRIVSKAGDHLPFSLTSEHSYFIGYTDLVTENSGKHIPGEMNGLWFPPLRVIRGFHIERKGIRLKPEVFTTFPDKRILEFDKFYLELSMLIDGTMIISAVPRNGATLAVNLVMETAVLPVWMSSVNPDHRIHAENKHVVIDVPRYDRRFLIFASPPSLIKLENNIIRIKINGRTSVIITDSRKPDSITKNLQTEIGHSSKSAYERLSFSMLRSSSSALDSGFYWAKANLSWLVLDIPGIGRGITAGHPEFPWFFGVDTFYAINGLLISGMHDVVKGTLSILIDHAMKEKGRVPHEIVTNGFIYNKGNIEETAMLPESLLRYYRWSGDLDFLRNNASAVTSSVDYLLDNGLKGPAIMEDTMAGSGTDIDSMCYFSEGLLAASEILQILSMNRVNVNPDQYRRYEKESYRIRNLIVDKMWMEDMQCFGDRMIDNEVQHNSFWTSILPFVTGIAKPWQYAKFVNSSDGGLSLIEKEEGLAIDRNGSIMPLGNGLMAVAARNYGDDPRELEYFRKVLDSLGKFSPGSFPEITNRNDGCYLQAWSAAILLENLVNGMMGVDTAGKELSFLPKRTIGALGSRILLENIAFRGSRYDLAIDIDRSGDMSHKIVALS